MGDHCSMEIEIKHVPRVNIKEFVKIFCENFCDLTGCEGPCIDGPRTFYIDSINYAGEGPLGELASLGVIFDGSHGSGGDYEARDFVSYNGCVWESEPNGPMAHVAPDGTVDENDVRYAVRFHEARTNYRDGVFPDMIWPSRME